MRSLVFVSLLGFLALSCNSVETKEVSLNENLKVKATLIYSEDFSSDMSNWKVEQMPGGSVFVNDGKLEISDSAGCTVWFTKKLEGPILIEYDAVVLKNGGQFERASDLNCFWMATDPANPDNLFVNSEKRGGKFTNYGNSLALYYVGLGGHYNSKTRFRRYDGEGNTPLLPEHDFSDEKYMITPNINNHIRLVAYNGLIQYHRNEQHIFNFEDENPYTSGHFGIRTVHNHMTVDNVKVYALEEIK